MNSLPVDTFPPSTADLRSRVEGLEGVMDCAPVGLGLLDPELRYVWVNEQFASINARSARAHIGRTVREIRPDLDDALGVLLRATLEHGLAAPVFVIGARGADQRLDASRWTLSLRRLSSSAGEILGLAMVAEPRAEQPASESESQGNDFIEAFAHELKNPLTPILSAAQMLQRYGDTQPDVVRWAGDSIARQVRELTVIINDVLDLARASAADSQPRRAPFELPDAIRNAAETCRSLASERGQTVSVTVPSGPLSVLGDGSSFENAIRKVLSNALKRTPTGGTIALTAEQQGDDAVVRICDSGPSIDHRDLESIFEPFPKGDEGHLRQPRGRGVDLALARRLLTLQGGSLLVQSQETGHGSEFVIRIPAVSP